MRGRIFCSPKCHFVSQRYPSEVIIDKIKDFYNINQRIPLKSEFNHTSAAKKRFGTWNNAIIASGFEPNPIRFAKKYLANDGHKCDSLSEKIIDDWLSRRKIKHERSVLYITGKQFTADFVVGKYWIEFFGLAGELKRYDYLKMEKIKLARKLNLDLIGIYPKDLFPKGNLNEKLSMLI